MSTTKNRFAQTLGRLLPASSALQMTVGPEGPRGTLQVPQGEDGRFEVVTAQGRSCLSPDARSYYLYFSLPQRWRERARDGLFVQVEYYGDRYGQFRLQYASTDRSSPLEGLYKPAEQRWSGETAGLFRFRQALFALPDFDPTRTQNLEASFRLEFRRDLRVCRVVASREAPFDAAAFPAVAPLPELQKLPGRFYPINYLFIEITNACNFKCTWCPDDIMSRRRGFMKKDKVFRILEEIGAKKAWLGPLYPVKLHQMGEPMLHPELVAIVERAEALGVGIELNTNCGLITGEKLSGLYRAGLTNLILSYQTPDAASFGTRKAPRLHFDEYRDKVRLAVERKVALAARSNLEIDIMNTKYADGYRIVSEDAQALAFLTDWIEFARGLERRYGLAPREHDFERIRSFQFLDQDENGSRYTLLDGVHLIWKRCHSWGNVIDTGGGLAPEAGRSSGMTSSYCPAPYDQFVIQWNGDVVSCCTDYEGHTKTANVFAETIEAIWTGERLKQRRQDMLEGRLLDVCALCQGAKQGAG